MSHGPLSALPLIVERHITHTRATYLGEDAIQAVVPCLTPDSHQIDTEPIERPSVLSPGVFHLPIGACLSRVSPRGNHEHSTLRTEKKIHFSDLAS